MERIVEGIETVKVANYIIRMCREYIRDYGELTLADVKDFEGVSPAFEDQNMRWSSDDLVNADFYVSHVGFRNYAIVLASHDEWLEIVLESNAFCFYI